MAETLPADSALTGVQRAAVLLMSLGEAEAAEVLKFMSAKEVQLVGTAMATISSITHAQVHRVVDDFVGELQHQTSLGVGADDYVRKVLIKALGEEKAAGLIDRILIGSSATKGLDTLKWMEPKAITELVRNEHPQIIAIVLAHLDPDQAAEVIKLLPEAVRSEAMLRIATLDGVSPNALDELNGIMERQFSGNSSKSSSIGGIKAAASILNFLDAGIEQTVMQSVEEVDAELCNKLRDQMFVFDNIAELDDRAIQTVLREVPGERLGVALRGADPKSRDKILKNMSQRASQLLLDDMEARGPVKLSEVELAQKEILTIVRRLADDGTIALGGAGGEEYL